MGPVGAKRGQNYALLRNVHNVLGEAARRAGLVNVGIELSAVRVGLHDEIFQGPRPVLAGVDAQSTFCYLLAAETHRDGDTWAVHLLDAKARGLEPEFTIADAGHFPHIEQPAAVVERVARFVDQ